MKLKIERGRMIPPVDERMNRSCIGCVFDDLFCEHLYDLGKTSPNGCKYNYTEYEIIELIDSGAIG